jgi:hypothetical protein
LDFLLDAGLPARFYRWDLPGFLSPVKMFQYIPLGYVAFPLRTILLVWLTIGLPVSGFRAGAMFGLKVGILIAAAGAVSRAGLAAPRLRPLAVRVVALSLVCLVGGIVLQNIGANPAAKTFPGRVGIHWEQDRRRPTICRLAGVSSTECELRVPGLRNHLAWGLSRSTSATLSACWGVIAGSRRSPSLRWRWGSAPPPRSSPSPTRSC